MVGSLFHAVSFFLSESCYFADKQKDFYEKMREEMRRANEEDKLLDRQRRRYSRIKEKMKWKRGAMEEEGDEDEEDISESEGERTDNRKRKRSKIYFNSDDDGDNGDDIGKGNDKVEINTDSVTLAEQEALALKLLSSMQS